MNRTVHPFRTRVAGALGFFLLLATGRGDVPFPGSPPQSPSQHTSRTGFLEIQPERRQLYAGETAEVIMKAYVDADLQIVDFDRELRLPGDGFLIQPSVGPDVTLERQGKIHRYRMKREIVDGHPFHILSFQTSLTAVKPGTFTVGPLEYQCAVAPMRNQSPSRPRQLLDSLYGDPSNDPARPIDQHGQAGRHRLTLRSDPSNIEVIPLPDAGRPDDFDGAIGRFSLQVGAGTTEMKVGEAFTLSMTLSGRGNFERISGVEIEASDAWRAYPPRARFEPADELHLSGAKTFEQTFVTLKTTVQTPAVTFTYFDPLTKQYVVLRGASLPLAVTESASPLPFPQPAPAPHLNGHDERAFDPEKLPLLSARDIPLDRISSPILAHPLFWFANGAAALAILGLAFRNRRSDSTLPGGKRRSTTMRRRQALKRLERLRKCEDPDSFVRESRAIIDELIHRNGPGAPMSERRAALTAWIDAVRWAPPATKSDYFYRHRESWLSVLKAIVED